MCVQKTRLFTALLLEDCHEIALNRLVVEYLFFERRPRSRDSLLSLAMAMNTVCALILFMSYKQNIMRTLYQDETRYNGAKTSNRGVKDCSSAAILKLSSDVKWLGSSDHKAHR